MKKYIYIVKGCTKHIRKQLLVSKISCGIVSSLPGPLTLASATCKLCFLSSFTCYGYLHINSHSFSIFICSLFPLFSTLPVFPLFQFSVAFFSY